MYQKVATIRDLPKEVIPPCIPFVGPFPPRRHPIKERRLSEMLREPPFSRSSEHDLNNVSCTGGEKEEDVDGRNGEVHHRVANSFRSTTVNPSRLFNARNGSCSCEVTDNGHTLHEHPSSETTVNNGNIDRKSADSQMMPDGDDQPEGSGSNALDSQGEPNSRSAVDNGQARPQSQPLASNHASTESKQRTATFLDPKSIVTDQRRARRGGATGSGQEEEETASGLNTPSNWSDITAKSLDMDLLNQVLLEQSQQTQDTGQWQRAPVAGVTPAFTVERKEEEEEETVKSVSYTHLTLPTS